MRRFILIILFSIFVLNPCNAQSESVKKLIAASDSTLRAGGENIQYMQSLLNVGTAALKEADFITARIYYSKTASIAKESEGEESYPYILAKLYLGESYTTEGDYDEGVRQFLDIYPIIQNNYSDERVFLLSSIDLGSSYFNLNNLSESIRYWSEAVEYLRIHDDPLQSLSGNLSTVGFLLKSNGQLLESFDAYKESVDILTDQGNLISDDYCTGVVNLQFLADTLGNVPDYSKYTGIYLDYLKNIGEENSELYQWSNATLDAVSQIKQTPSSQDWFETLWDQYDNNISNYNSLRSSGDYEASVEYAQKNLSIAYLIYGKESTKVPLMKLLMANSISDKGDFANSVEMYLDALKDLKSYNESDDNDRDQLIQSALFKVSYDYYRHKDYLNAIKYQEEYLAQTRPELGQYSSDYFNQLCWLDLLYGHADMKEKSVLLFKDAIDYYKEGDLLEQAYIENESRRLASAYFAVSDFDNAARIMNNIRSYVEKQYGKLSSQFVDISNALATIFLHADKRDEASSIFYDNLNLVSENSALKRSVGHIVYQALSNYCQYEKDIQGAIKYSNLYKQAALQKFGKGSVEYGDALTCCSEILNSAEQYRDARNNAEEAIKILRANNVSEDDNLSIAIYQYDLASSKLKENSSLMSDHGSFAGQMFGDISIEHARALQFDAYEYLEKGQFNEALDVARQAYEIFVALNSETESALLSANAYALACSMVGDYDTSISLYKEILESNTSEEMRLIALDGLALDYSYVDDIQNELSTRLDILELYSKSDKTQDTNYALAETQLAKVLYSVGEAEDASVLIDDALSLFAKDNIITSQAIAAYSESARIYERLDNTRSLKDIDIAISLMNQIDEDQFDLEELCSLYSRAASYVPDELFDEKCNRFESYIDFVSNHYPQNSFEYSGACYQYAEYLYFNENYAKAYDLCEKSASYLENAELDSFNKYFIGLITGELAYMFHDYYKAERRFEMAKSGAAAEYSLLSDQYLSTLNSLHNLYSRTGDYMKDLSITKEKDFIYASIYGNSSAEYADHCITDGISLRSIFDYETSVASFKKAYHIYKDIEDSENLFYSALLLAETYINMNDYSSAIAILDSICGESVINANQKCILDAMLAFARALGGDLDSAKNAAESAEQLYCDSTWDIIDDSGFATLYLPMFYDYLGLYYNMAKEYEKSDKMLTQAINLAKEDKSADFSEMIALLKVQNAMNLADLRKRSEAISAADDAFKVVDGNYASLSTTYVNMKFYQLYTRYITDSKIESSLNRDMLNLVRSQAEILLPQMRDAQRSSFWEHHSNTKDLLFSQGKKISPDILYEYALLSKNILLNSSIDIAEAVKSTADVHLMNMYAKIFGEESLDETDSNLLSLEEELMYSLINKYGYKSNLRSSFKDVSSSLKKGETAVEFVSYKHLGTVADTTSTEMICALVAKHGWKSPKILTLCPTSELIKIIDKPYDICDPYSYASDKIYEIIWEPILKYAGNSQTIIFSPDGILYQIPIEYAYSSVKKKSLDDIYDIRRVSTTKDIGRMSADKISSSVLYGGLFYDVEESIMKELSFGYSRSTNSRGWSADNNRGMNDGWTYLEGAKEEVDLISNILSSDDVDTKTLSTIYGNEESFKSLSGSGVNHLHMATHGFYVAPNKKASFSYISKLTADDPDDAMKRSGLILAGANAAWEGRESSNEYEDGILTSEEIARLNLRDVELVVLSACETALGDLSNDGVLGLQRAFKLAGAKSIVMSLWKVDDYATEIMMTEFYSAMSNGMNRPDAFSYAISFLKEKYPEPYYWAGFVMLD